MPSLVFMPRGRITHAAALIACGASLACEEATAARTHRLEANPATVVYGYYWADAKPVLRIASGDVIDVETLLSASPTDLERAGVPASKIQPALRRVDSEVTPDRRGPGPHILTGPVYVEGAEPGDALEVKIVSVDLMVEYGFNFCRGLIPTNCDASAPLTILNLDLGSSTSELKPGIVVPLRPFFGSMGVAPPAAVGRVSSIPPGMHAGNLDNRELTAGATLYIPVFVPGALFAIGDGHAAQGDGEVNLTAIETSLRGRVQLTVRKDMKLGWPRAETPSDYISMAAHQDLKVATTIAVQEMVDFLVATKQLTRHEAYRLVSLAGNVAITQLVDEPAYGVHVKMPRTIFR
jgi:acetamidase/formamidase